MKVTRIYRKPDGWIPDRNVPCELVMIDGRPTSGKALGLTLAEALAAGVPFRLKDPSRPAGDCLNVPPIDQVEIGDTATSPEQNFRVGLVEAGLAEGWISIAQGKLTLRAKPEDLVYTIKRGPGHYCCHCGVKLVDAAAFVAPKITAGMQHVATAHAGKRSPDASNPAGYRRLNHYECVLGEKQHAKFKFKAARPGGVNG